MLVLPAEDHVEVRYVEARRPTTRDVKTPGILKNNIITINKGNINLPHKHTIQKIIVES